MKLSHTIISDLGNKQNQTTIYVIWDDGIQEVTAVRLSTFRKSKDNRYSIESNDVDIMPLLEGTNTLDTIIDSIDWNEIAYQMRMDALNPEYEHEANQ